MADVGDSYKKSTSSICTDTTQTSCQQTQALHNQMTAMTVDANRDAHWEKPAHPSGPTITVAGGGRREGFQMEYALRVSWMSLFTAGTLFVLYGIVR
jgi:hypothetical protein